MARNTKILFFLFVGNIDDKNYFVSKKFLFNFFLINET